MSSAKNVCIIWVKLKAPYVPGSLQVGAEEWERESWTPGVNGFNPEVEHVYLQSSDLLHARGGGRRQCAS